MRIKRPGKTTMRAFAIGITAVLCTVAILSAVFPFPEGTQWDFLSIGTSYQVSANPDWLTGEQYRQAYNISQATGAGTNYQVPITVFYSGVNLTLYDFDFVQQVISYNDLFGVGARGEDTKIAKVDNMYYMVTAVAPDGNYLHMDLYMLNATSLAGPWGKTQADPIVSRGTSSQWDYTYLRATGLTSYNDTWYLYYMGFNSTNRGQIGVATTSAEDFPLNWTKYGSNPVLSPGAGEWDSYTIDALDIQPIGDSPNIWYGHYAANDGTASGCGIGVCYGSSPFGPFTKYAGNPIIEQTESYETASISRNSLIKVGDMLYGASECAGASTIYQVCEYSGQITGNITDVVFTKNPDNPIIPSGAGSGTQTANPCYWYEDGNLYLFALGVSSPPTAPWYDDLYVRQLNGVFTDEHCNADFSDIRFTDNDQATKLDYWLEDSVSSSYANFWVEVADNLTVSSAIIYAYYGNATFTSESNGPSTFIQYHASADASFHDSDVTTPGASLRYRAKVKVTGTGNALWGIGDAYDKTGDDICIQSYTAGNIRYVEAHNDGAVGYDSEAPHFNDGAYHIIEMNLLAGNWLKGWVSDNIIGTSVTTNLPVGDSMGLIMGEFAGTAIQDWSFIAKFCDPEPSLVSVGVEEEYAEAIPEVTNAPSTNDFGILVIGTNSSTTINYFQIENTGGVTVDVTIYGTNATGGDDVWALAYDASPGENIFGLLAGLDDDDDNFDTVVNATGTLFLEDLVADATQDWGLEICMPTSLSGYDAQEMTATITLVASEAT